MAKLEKAESQTMPNEKEKTPEKRQALSERPVTRNTTRKGVEEKGPKGDLRPMPLVTLKRGVQETTTD